MRRVHFSTVFARFRLAIARRFPQFLRAACVLMLLLLQTSAVAGTPLPNVQQFSAGGYHICALTGGAVQCWGFNSHGQLGNGNYLDGTAPAIVKGLESGVTAVTSGGLHSCAIVGGGVKCWGYNVDGELGNGSTDDSNVPVTVLGLSNVVAISAGGYHTCALVSSGSVRCWGWNAAGQLGDGTMTATNTGMPTTVSGLSGATMLAAGGLHTCALVGGAVKCWGFNTDGELGDGSTSQSLVPANVNGLSGVTSISAGARHTCAIQTAGTLKCWGDNTLGQLGNNSNVSTAAGPPVAVSGIVSGATALASGGYHTCAVVAGAEKCWGDNETGELGIGSLVNSHVPANVTGLGSGVLATSAGLFFSCALSSAAGSQQLKCWGDNVDGELGLSDTIYQHTPSAVVGLGSGATTLAAGPDALHACAIVGGAAKCWGLNGYGQLGNGATLSSSVPVTATGLSSGVTELADGESHTCAVASGKAMCWGHNANGQLGNGSTTDSHTPVTAIASNVIAIGAGAAHSCAILAGGSVKCWGANGNGELGDGSTTERHAPVTVAGLSSPAVAISIGALHTCVVLSNGKIQCWGFNGNGQLGNGTNTTTYANPPVTVSNIASGATAVSGGDAHTCAIVSGGVECWGYGQLGQLGNGLSSDSLIPVAASGLGSGVGGIYAGFNYSCAIAAGTAYCWGDTQNFGNVSGTTQSVPSALPLGNTVSSIGTGAQHGCAIISGAVYCVGTDYYGQLGDGRSVYLETPAVVVEGDDIFKDGFDGA
jgi:alpha-tubulin suppressor-like RCC1 family protein